LEQRDVGMFANGRNATGRELKFAEENVIVIRNAMINANTEN
jgi:hypothetical protein